MALKGAIVLVYTSNFAKSKKYPRDILVSIARRQPRGCRLRAYQPLFPSESALLRYRTTGNQEEFEKEYREQLRNLHPAQVAGDLEGKILLCYEKEESFCHRHIVRQWLNASGYPCEEA